MGLTDVTPFKVAKEVATNKYTGGYAPEILKRGLKDGKNTLDYLTRRQSAEEFMETNALIAAQSEQTIDRLNGQKKSDLGEAIDAFQKKQVAKVVTKGKSLFKGQSSGTTHTEQLMAMRLSEKYSAEALSTSRNKTTDGLSNTNELSR